MVRRQVLLWHDDSPGIRVWIRPGILRRLGLDHGGCARTTEMLQPDSSIGGGFPGMNPPPLGSWRDVPPPVVDIVVPPPAAYYGRWWQRRCRARLRREHAVDGHWGRCDRRGLHIAEHALERGFYVVTWQHR